MRVFLTGGTGFIGSEVARRLRARGDEVSALVRSPSRAGGLAAIGCDPVQGDVADAGAVRAGMARCDAAIHVAAMYEVGIPRSRRPAMYAANVTGTENVLGAALDLGLRRVVHVSTVNAFGNTHGRVVDEDHQRDPRFLSYYDETKYRAHQIALDFIQRGLPCVTVQPGQVYGPDDHSEIGRTMERFLAGRLPALAFPDLGMNFVHRDDVAEGILLALDRGRPGQAYVLGGELGTLRELFDTLARLSGRRPVRRYVPAGLLKLMTPIAPVLGRALGLPPNLREAIGAAKGVTYWARDDRARRELGYRPRPLEQGLRDTLAATGRAEDPPARLR